MTTATPTTTEATTTAPAYDQLRARLREVAHLTAVAHLAGWDQETYMPAGGAAGRANQSAALAAVIHQRSTDATLGELIAACEADDNVQGSPRDAANIREVRRDYDRATKLPESLVSELARTGSQAQEAWKVARGANDFKAFAPWLEKMLDLSRQKAECYGTPEGGERYDALLDEYEPAARASEIDAIFTPLGERLSALIADLRENGTEPDDTPLNTRIPEEMQHALGLRVLEVIGFDLKQGRLDVTTHPFCQGVGPGDTRLTTRYRDERFTDALYGTMHEGGHGLYEQGLPRHNEGDPFGEPIADAISLGIHESQSRMWENSVGRSNAFWTWALPVVNETCGNALGDYTVEQMNAAVNTAKPSFIRVEADEATYNLHVMLRFGLERAMIKGDLAVQDLPGAWNERFKQLLGMDVPDDRRGCLQDVHWSFGLIGYFPTYTLGNLYAAQFWETINEAIPTLDDQIAAGEMGELLAWLRTNIHAPGRQYHAGELCERITGKPLGAAPLLRHLESRIRPVYGL